MALLVRLAVCVGLVGCYTPDLRDCAVSCTAKTGCADGEACGADGWCAAPGVDCRNHDTIDAGMRTLHIVVTGKGTVVLNQSQTCSNDCMYAVAVGVAANLVAQPIMGNHPFQMWTGMGCSGMNPQCSVTPTTDLSVGAMFR